MSLSKKLYILIFIISLEILTILYIFLLLLGPNYFRYINFYTRNEISELVSSEFEKISKQIHFLVSRESNSINDSYLKYYELITYPDNYGNLISTRATINKDNFRGRNYSLEKPNNTIRIISIGDSHTFGYALNDNETFSYQLEYLLNNNTKEKRFEVLNMGYPGYNMIQKLEILRSKAIKYFPDIIILQYDGDDIIPNAIMKWRGEIIERIVSKYKISNYENLSYIHDTLIGSVFDRFLANNKDFLMEKMIVEPTLDFISLSKKYNFKLIIISIWPRLYDEKFLINVSSFENITYLNVHRDIFNFKNYEISRYERHFNSYGQRLIAERLYDIIVSLI